MTLHLTARYGPGMQIGEPNLTLLDTSSFLELVTIGKQDTIFKDRETIINQDLTFTIFDSGAFWIPAIPYKFIDQGDEGQVSTNELLVEVTNVAVDSVHLAPIKPIIKEPLKLEDFMPYLLGAAGIAALAWLAIFLYRRRHKKEKIPPPEILIPAHEMAFKKLGLLKEAKLWQQGKIKAYQSKLTYVVREYLERRFRILALESTTDEIVQQLSKLSVPEQYKQDLQNMLQIADMVKFAKAKPSVEIHEELWSQAEKFIQTTKSEELVVPISELRNAEAFLKTDIQQDVVKNDT